MKKKVLILGGGIAGMSASYHLNKLKVDNLVFEKKNKTGGLLANFKIKNFTFDQFVHFSFAKDKYTKNFFQKSSDYFLHREPKPNNYYNGTWLEHSPQLHLYNLSFLEKMKIITSYVLRNRMEKKK